jgi:hypothetical protein
LTVAAKNRVEYQVPIGGQPSKNSAFEERIRKDGLVAPRLRDRGHCAVQEAAPVQCTGQLVGHAQPRKLR